MRVSTRCIPVRYKIKNNDRIPDDVKDDLIDEIFDLESSIDAIEDELKTRNRFEKVYLSLMAGMVGIVAGVICEGALCNLVDKIKD